MRCESDGGYGAPRSHRCECNRPAGHPLDSARPHGCSCGAPWACDDCHDADVLLGCAGCGANPPPCPTCPTDTDIDAALDAANDRLTRKGTDHDN